MKIILSLSLVLLFTFSACSSDKEPVVEPEAMNTEKIHKAFISNLSSLCGETFTGASTFPDTPENVLVGTELRAHISHCEEGLIQVDLYRDIDTWHASWIITEKVEGLHLFHDHIGAKEYPEGEQPLSGYGGFADSRGSEFIQYFPADEATAEMLPEAATNEWRMEMDLQNGIYVYGLERHNAPRFRAELYLN